MSQLESSVESLLCLMLHVSICFSFYSSLSLDLSDAITPPKRLKDHSYLCSQVLVTVSKLTQQLYVPVGQLKNVCSLQ